MTTSTITVTHQSIAIDNVRDIVVTEIVEVDGTFSRAVRFLGEPVNGETPIEILEVKVSSTTKTDIELSAPGFEF